MNNKKEQIKNILREIYRTPSRHLILYSGADITASERLNDLPYWHWKPNKIISVTDVNYIGNALVAQSLGCPPVLTSEGKEWLSPIIFNASDINSLKIPKLFDTKAGQIIESAKKLKAQLDEEKSDTQIVIPDTAAPLSIAELMWRGNFYESLLLDESAVHKLLQKITDFTIEFTLEFQKAAGERYAPCPWPPVWSEGTGCYLGDDAMSLVSPAMHKEFSVPYINQISKACGGIYYHSCTWRECYFDNIKSIENVKLYNWNPGNSCDSAVIMKEFAGSAALAPHITKNMHLDNDLLYKGFENEFELFKYLFEGVPDNGSAIFYLSDICSDKDIIEAIYDFLALNNCTP